MSASNVVSETAIKLHARPSRSIILLMSAKDRCLFLYKSFTTGIYPGFVTIFLICPVRVGRGTVRSFIFTTVPLLSSILQEVAVKPSKTEKNQTENSTQLRKLLLFIHKPVVCNGNGVDRTVITVKSTVPIPFNFKN